jgi:hypothetical protein
MMDAQERYSRIVTPGTPHLWVNYDLVDGKRIMTWGVNRPEHVPSLDMIGAVIRAQNLLSDRSFSDMDPWFEWCTECRFVIAWYGPHPEFFLHKDIPIDKLLGMLEVVKSTLMASMIMRQQQQQHDKVRMYGTDGRVVN